MTKNQKISLFLTRIAMGWLFLYAGLTKLINPEWTAAGFLKGAKTFPGFYAWFGEAGNIGWVDFLNEWGLTLLGVSLILGIGVRLSSILGVFLMVLYYFPKLNFPIVGTHSYIVDEHVVYTLVLIFFFLIKAGRSYGLDEVISKKVKNWVG